MSIIINDGEPQKFSLPLSNQDTHFEDGSINPDFKEINHVHVNCDLDCLCAITEHVPTSCELKAVLSFPEFKENYYGYNADI